MEKERSGNRIHRRTTKMPTAAASNAQDAVAAASAIASSPGGIMVAVDSSPSRPSSPNAMMPTTSSTTPTPAPLTSATFLKYHYTRDELLCLKSCPLSRLKPKFLTPVHELCDICLELDSSTSISSRNTFDEQTPSSVHPGIPSKRHVSLGEQRSSVGQPTNNNSDCDADAHIALVPQRSSFGIGCHVAPGRNANSPEAKRERNRRDGHRIGSGRIQISEKYVERDHHDHRGIMSDRERDRNDRWYDRCGNGAKVTKRDYDGRRSEVYRDAGRYLGESPGRSGGAEPPEWFTEGPLSQSDTIELHGFECSQKMKSAPSNERLLGSSSIARDDAKTPQQPKSLPRMATQVVVMETAAAVPRESKGELSSPIFSDEAEGRKCGREGREHGAEDEDQSIISTVLDDVVNPLLSVIGKNLTDHPPPPPPSIVPSSLPPDPTPPPHPPPPPTYQTSELDFNAFFNAESIPGLNDLFSLEPEQAKSGSRFQQWFHFSSHGNSHSESRRSSLTDEFGYINDIIYGHNSPLGQMSPPPPNPLPPPAASLLRSSQPTFSSAEKYSDETQNLLEMLQKANADGCIGTVPFNGRRWDATAAAAAGIGAEKMPPMNYCMSSQGDGRTDAKDVEAGLKAILSGAIFANTPLLSGFSPSMAASLVIPVGTKVTLLSDLEAGLKGLNVVNGNNGGVVHSAPKPPPLLGGASDCHSNSVPASSGIGRPGSSSHGDDEGVIGGQQLLSSSAGSVFAARSTDLAAYKKLLGLIVEPHACCQTAINNSLPIVTSPTSVSMSNLEANQSNNSLANNQRDFIQRYLLQQQQLKMLHHHHHQHPLPPPLSEGGMFAPPQSALPPHLIPPPLGSDLAQSYLSPGMLGDPMPSSGLLMAPNQHRTDFALSPGAELQHQQPQPPHQQGSSCGYDRRSGLLGLSLNLSCSDDLALLPNLSSEFSGPYLPSHLQPGQMQGGQMQGGQMQGVHLVTPRPRCPGGQMVHSGLLPPPSQQQQQQHHHHHHHHEMTTMTTTMPIGGGGQMSSNKHHLLLQQESAKQTFIHQAALQHHHHQQQQQHQQQQHQMARMTHVSLHDPFGNSSKLNGAGALSPHPVLRPHLTLQPPPVSSHPSPAGMSMLGPQSLLHQPPQSPRRAPSPIMFGNQPPMNLTAPLPVHLGPMTPILSPTALSPNTLQVAQTGSNLSSPVMRVPSPQELSGLAQSILQNALIKKQLEEQKERFIRRQQERNKSPKPQAPSSAAAAVAMTTASRVATSAAAAASPLVPASGGLLDARKMSQSFLPTSVLRKMAASSKADERTRLTDSSLSSCSGEKSSVPLLKIVKPDEDSTEDEDKENKSLTNIIIPSNNGSSSRSSLECHGGSTCLQFVSDDRLSELSVNSSVTMEGAVSLVVPGATAVSRALTQSVASVPPLAAACSSAEEAGLQNQTVTRCLLGQGLMNNASSVASPPSPGRLLPVSPSSVHHAAIHPNSSSAAAATGSLASSGRQIKGKKMMPEHLSLCSASSTSKDKPSEYHHQLQQQQQQFFAGGSSSANSSSSNRTAAALNLHGALEMAKLLDHQRKGMLSSPMPPPPPPPGVAPPSITTQFVSAGPESSAYAVAAPMPRMIVHPTFGVNSPAAAAAASNALLLQRLAYPNLQRGALPSVNHLNLNQLALMQAVQLQAQQQQQQLWNRNAVRSANSSSRGGGGGGGGAAFATSSSLPPSTAATVAVASADSSNKPEGGGGGNRGGGGVNGLKTTSVGSSAMQMKADNDVFMSGVDVHPHPNDAAADRSSEAAIGLAPGPDAGRVMASSEHETGVPHHQQQSSVGCSRSDLASDVGNLTKWFGSDVFNHQLPPLVASAGQKVLTVDEIEGWQRAVGES